MATLVLVSRSRHPSAKGTPPTALLLALLLGAGCHPSPQPPVYQDEQGFRMTPPSGWVERARSDALPAAAAHGHQADLPLPPVGGPGRLQERLLVRYDRLTPGQMAWLRATVVEVPASTDLATCLVPPAAGWRREAAVERLEVGGLPAARIAYRGRWENQDYLNETVAVRKAERVYLLSASFPATDAEARAQVRQAIADAVWP